MKKVGFQGVPGAYSEIVANEFFKIKTVHKPCKDFRQIFNGVENNRLDYGVIPIENSLAGSIHENYDHLQDRKVWICGEYNLRVSHNLLTIPGGALNKIRYVYSHPQALAQCADYIRSLPKAQPIPYFDTAGSAKFISHKEDNSSAAIASSIAAKEYSLKTLAKGIENNNQNYTRFLIIKKNSRREAKAPLKAMKTSIVFSLQNIPGGLHKSLSVFAIRDIDLFKIESRPIPHSPFKYVFYLDFKGDSNDEAQKKALDHLSEITSFLKVLGSYPIAKLP